MGTSLLLQRARRSDVDTHPFEAYYEDKVKRILTGLKRILAYLLSCGLVFSTIPKDDAQNGLAFQKDLGATTDQVAAAMTEFNPDKSWTVVE